MHVVLYQHGLTSVFVDDEDFYWRPANDTGTIEHAPTAQLHSLDPREVSLPPLAALLHATSPTIWPSPSNRVIPTPHLSSPTPMGGSLPSLTALFPMIDGFCERSPSPPTPSMCDDEHDEEQHQPFTVAARKRARNVNSPSLDGDADIKQGRGPMWVRNLGEDCGPEVSFGRSSVLYRSKNRGFTPSRPDMDLRRIH